MADLETVRDAQAMLGRAHDSLRGIRAELPGLAAAMSWRSRSAHAFVEALADWTRLLERVDAELERWEELLEMHRRQALAAGSAAAGDAGWGEAG
jgi:hypothetical protein